MADIKEYWREVRSVEATLLASLGQDKQSVVYIVSVENKSKGTSAGSVCEADIETAARMIVDGTHKVASESEVAAWKTHQEQTFKANQALELERKQQFAMPEDIATLARVAATLVTQNEGKGAKK